MWSSLFSASCEFMFSKWFAIQWKCNQLLFSFPRYLFQNFALEICSQLCALLKTIASSHILVILIKRFWKAGCWWPWHWTYGRFGSGNGANGGWKWYQVTGFGENYIKSQDLEQISNISYQLGWNSDPQYVSFVWMFWVQLKTQIWKRIFWNLGEGGWAGLGVGAPVHSNLAPSWQHAECTKPHILLSTI